jgi:hypothetical protein
MKPVQLSEWHSFNGMREFVYEPVSDNLPSIQRVDVELITEGCSVFVSAKGGSWLVFSGAGRNDVSFGITGGFCVSLVGDNENTATSVRLPWYERKAAPVGWSDRPSFTQLDLKAPDAVSVQFLQMQRNFEQNMRVRDEKLAAAMREIAALKKK